MRRPSAPTDLGSKFVLQLFVWDPKRRLGAKECLEHASLKSEVASVAVRAMLSGMSESELRDVAFRAYQSGTPMSMDALSSSTIDTHSRPDVPPTKKFRLVAKTSTKVSTPGVANPSSPGNAKASSQGVAEAWIQDIHTRTHRSFLVTEQVSEALRQVQAKSRSSGTCKCRGNCGQRCCK